MARPKKNAARGVKVKQFWMTHGTPNEQSIEPKGYVLEADLRKGIIAVFEAFKPSSRMFDSASLARITDACSEATMITPISEHRYIDCVIDSNTGTTCRVVYWKNEKGLPW